MLLRRIAEHLRSNNWTAILLDFVIVVLGVFVGMQVSNWNDEQRARSDESRYLEGLRSDLEDDLLEIDETAAFAGYRVQIANYLLGEGELPEAPQGPVLQMMRKLGGASPEEVLNLSYLPLIFSFGKIVQPQGDVYAELVSTGNLGVISNSDLASYLSKYYSRHREATVAEELIWDRFRTSIEILEANGISFASPLEPQDFKKAIDNNPILAVHVRNQHAFARLHSGVLVNTRVMAEKALSLME